MRSVFGVHPPLFTGVFCTAEVLRRDPTLIAVEGAEMAQQQLTNIRHQRLEPDSAIGADWRPLSRQAAPPAPVLELLA